MIDRNVWGRKKKYRYTTDYINYNLSLDPPKTSHQLKRDQFYSFYPLLTDIYGRFIKDNNGKCVKGDIIELYRDFSIEQHLIACDEKDKNNYVFYTSNYKADYNMICVDIDPTETTTIRDLNSVASYLSSIFPNSYYDYGTSGHSLHFYIIIYFNQFSERFVEGINEALYRNSLYSSLHSFLSHRLKDFDVTCDGVKGSCSVYHDDKVVYNGSLITLPIIMSQIDFYTLTESTIYLETDIRALLRKDKVRINTTPTLPPIYTTTNSKDISVFQANNKDKLGKTDFEDRVWEDIYNTMTDSFYMTKLFVQDYFRFYYKTHRCEPSLDDVKRVYEDYIGIKDKKREQTIESCYNKTKDGFDSKRLQGKGNKYYFGKYYKEIDKYDMDNITAWANGETNYKKRKIKKEDLDIVLGYIIDCFNTINRADRQDRISKTGLINRYKDVQDQVKRAIPKYDSKKVFAIFKFLIVNGYIELINTQYKCKCYGMKYKALDKIKKVMENNNEESNSKKRTQNRITQKSN